MRDKEQGNRILVSYKGMPHDPKTSQETKPLEFLTTSQYNQARD